MRLILIALCLALANASYFGKTHFRNLLNRYETPRRTQQGWGQEDLLGEDNEYGNLYGSDDVDDYIDEYVQEIRRQRGLEREQCPRDVNDIVSPWGQNEEYGNEYEDEEEFGRYGQSGRRGSWNEEHQGRWDRGEDEEEFGQYGQSGRRGSWNEERQGRWNRGEDELRNRWTGDEESESEFGSPLLKEVHDANTKLASLLYKESKEEKDDKNIVVSPLSIQLALAALNYGTRGTTRRQIGRVIAGSLKKEERRHVFKTLIRRLKGFQNTEYSTTGRKCQIRPVTGIFITQTTTHGQQQFMQMIKRNLGATVKHCNFHRQPQQCRQMINQWMGQKTQHKLARIVPQDAITDNTKMILVNSMHVKANWGPQMRRHVTKEAKFYPLDTKKVKVVEVMETQGRFKYHEEDEALKVVALPTQQKEMTLYVIVPKQRNGLTEVEKLYLQDGVRLKELLQTVDHRTPRHVGVQLPKFQIKHKIDVRRTLRKDGVTDAFDPLRADFSGITGVPKTHQDEMEDTYRTSMEEGMGGWSTGNQETKLHLNKFIHQSTVKITEQGITATTGSGSDFEEHEQYGRHGQNRNSFGRFGYETEESNVFDEITGYTRETTQKTVKANRAFAFVLKHNPTNQLVFVGRVIDAAQRKTTQTPETINVVDQF